MVERQGKQFVLYAGLLSLAHEQGLKSVTTSLVQVPSEANNRVAICTAVVTLEKDGVERVFTGIGDAAPNNVAPAMQTCLIRMAETRAKARALRDAVNIGVAAFEELGEEDSTDGAPERGYRTTPAPRPRMERTPPAVSVPARNGLRVTSSEPALPAEARNSASGGGGITETQIEAIRSLCRRHNIEADTLAREKFEAANLASLTSAQGSELIKSLNTKASAAAA